MNNADFLKAYNEGRNGANEFYRHSLVRNFNYSDGVKDCADAGCHWLIDIAATELPKVLQKKDENLGCFHIVVKLGKAKMNMTGSGDIELWHRNLDFTDMPEGTWTFYIGDDGDRYTMILPSEY